MIFGSVDPYFVERGQGLARGGMKRISSFFFFFFRPCFLRSRGI